MLWDVRKKDKRPKWMFEEVYVPLKEYWDSPAFKALSQQGKKNRASEKGGCLHTGGSVSTVETARRMVNFKYKCCSLLHIALI